VNIDSAARKQAVQLSDILDLPIKNITCKGCQAQAGQIPLQRHLFGDSYRCPIFGCVKRREVDYCGLCDQFPCNKRHPYTENAKLLPQKAKALFRL
jgi:hypothetical protein